MTLEKLLRLWLRIEIAQARYDMSVPNEKAIRRETLEKALTRAEQAINGIVD